jgi:predicted ATPase/DNA-binding winged helix-turn-helix (wHTH) protein
MEHEQHLLFGPFRLDPVTERLWCGEQAVVLRAKPLAVLRYLAAHPGRVVTKEELLKTVWAGTYVSKTVLKVCVREIREALREAVVAPRYLETVGRLGYRFIAPVVSSPRSGAGRPEFTIQNSKPDTCLVGREAELRQLHRGLEKALSGERQLIFVTGEPGIGKTALVDRFVDRVRSTRQGRIGRGQCIEHYGAGEAYLPVLEALGQVGREPEGKLVLDVLTRSAPTCLVQLPALVGEVELEALQRKVQGVTRDRMLREIAEAIEALTAERLLVLVFEDLHWSDSSTLELLAYLARRRERARLLVIGTYRPTEVLLSGHPLTAVMQELQAHGQCEELRLELLTAGAVAEYVAGRFAVEGQQVVPFQQLAGVVHRRTEGNALFMVNLVEHLVRQGRVVQEAGHWQVQENLADLAGSAPESLRQLIERQLGRLSAEEQQVLEVASIAGATFAVAAVVAGSKREAEAVEEICEELAWQGHFLQEEGVEEWPDGTLSGRYQFRHALYQSVLYERVAVARQVRLHRQIGEQEEQAYGDRTREIAVELAAHFERGRDYRRAVRYLQQAGENALRRSAPQEAILLLTKGLEVLKRLPETPDRLQQELTLQITLGAPLIATKGYAVPEVETAYARARALCQQVGETPQLVSVLGGLWVFYLVRGQLQTAQGLAEQALRLAQKGQDPALRVGAHYALGQTLFFLGEVASAWEHLEQGIALYDPRQDDSPAFVSGQDPGVVSLSYAALALWLLGYPNQALGRIHEALNLAKRLSHPFSQAFALDSAAIFYQFRREAQAAQERAEAAIRLCTEQGFPYWLAIGTLLQGWVLTVQGQGEEGMEQLRQGLAAWRATGAELRGPYFLTLLAEAYGNAGQAKEGLATLTEALTVVDKSGERFYEAELYRLKGELTLQTSGQSREPRVKEVEACFHQAIAIARKQQAKSLELRAVMSLSRLWQQQGKKSEAHSVLIEVYGWFTEGFETKDLQEAKALLTELGEGQ